MTGKEPVEGKLLRVFVGEADMVEGRPVFERLMEAAKEEGILGATTLRGIESFGQKGQTHTARILRLSEALPVVVEIVDEPDKIDRFIPVMDGILEKAGCGGMATTEKVFMRRYKATG